MPQVLTQRELNRATLSRQMLLERANRGIVETVEFLLGQQAQQTHDPYIGLWSRLVGFRHEALTELIVGTALVRATTMRGTLHLHSPRYLAGLRVLIKPVLERMWQGNFRKRFGDNDQEAVLAAAREVIDREPMTAGAIGKELSPRFPSAEPLAMTVLLQVRDALIQVPPTRIWGSGHAPLLMRADKYLGPVASNLDLATLVRRYLAANGPASVNDMQSWCGLTKLGEVFEAIAGELVTFENEDGRLLYDLPDAPRPGADVSAPVRFMPLYDNAFLGFEDRRRFLLPGRRADFLTDAKPAVLVDGLIAGGWAIESRKKQARLLVTPYRTLKKREIAEVEREGRAFLRFMHQEADGVEVEVRPAD